MSRFQHFGKLARAWSAGCLLLGVAMACSGGGSSTNGKADASGATDGNLTGTAKKCSFDPNNVIDRSAVVSVTAQVGGAVKSDSPFVVNAAGVAVGKTIDTVFVVKNTAPAVSALELLLTSIEVLPGASDDASWVCLAAGEDGKVILKEGLAVLCKDYKWGSVVPGDFEASCASRPPVDAARFVIRYKKLDGAVKTAKVNLKFDGDTKTSFFQFPIETKNGKPSIKVAPQLVEFGVVGVGDPAKQESLSILNTGEAPLVVTGIHWLAGDKTFSLKIGDKTIAGDKDFAFEPPLEIAPGAGQEVAAFFAPIDDKGRKATLQAITTATGDNTALLQGNLDVPCLLIKPDKLLDMGVVYVGADAAKSVILQNCGEVPAIISSLKLTEDSQGVFSFKDTKLPTDTAPISIPKNGKVAVNIDCAPPSENKDATGTIKPFTVKLGLTDNTVKPNKSINVQCYGTTATCPTPVIIPDPGEQIEPQKSIKLKGSPSFAAPGKQVKKYKWTLLKAPPGLAGYSFFPNDTTADVQFGVKTANKAGVEEVTINVVGEYQFKLQVWDDNGTESCAPSLFTLLVIPSVSIHVELLWDTPGDPTKGGGKGDDGTDMDLHFGHSKVYEATKCGGTVVDKCQPDQDKDGLGDPWFHGVYDTYWYNPHPNWGNAAAGEDNPSLDLDDTNGWGPENLNLQAPEDGVTYGVGVHYWDAFDFGDSTATVNVYVLGMLKGTFTQPMVQCDMWWVTQVLWPSGDLKDFGGATFKAPSAGKITPKYWSSIAATLGGVCKPPK